MEDEISNFQSYFNDSWLSVLWPHQWSVNIGSGNGLVPAGNNHYLSQCWPTSMSPKGITRPQGVNPLCADHGIFHRVPTLSGGLNSRLFPDHFCDFQDRFLSYLINNMLPRKGYKTQSKTKLISNLNRFIMTILSCIDDNFMLWELCSQQTWSCMRSISSIYKINWHT